MRRNLFVTKKRKIADQPKFDRKKRTFFLTSSQPRLFISLNALVDSAKFVFLIFLKSNLLREIITSRDLDWANVVLDGSKTRNPLRVWLKNKKEKSAKFVPMIFPHCSLHPPSRCSFPFLTYLYSFHSRKPENKAGYTAQDAPSTHENNWGRTDGRTRPLIEMRRRI